MSKILNRGLKVLVAVSSAFSFVRVLGVANLLSPRPLAGE